MQKQKRKLIMRADNQVYIKQAAIYFENFKSRNVSFSGIILITIFSLLALCASSVFADNYQFQVDGTYWRVDNGGGYELNDNKVAVTYYPTSIDDSVGPLAKASFLNKASSVTAYHSRTKYSDNYFSYKSSSDGVQGRFVASNDIIFDVAYSKDSYRDWGSNYDIESYLIGGGLYLNDSSSIKLSYQLIKDGNTVDADVYQADYEQVISFNGDTYVDVTGTVGHLDQDHVSGQTYVSGTIDYYFNRRLSVGAALFHTHDEETGYGIRAQYFFNNHIGLAATYSIVDDYDDGSGDIMTVNLVGRF